MKKGDRNEAFFANAKARPGIKAGAGVAPNPAKSVMKQARQTGQINLSNRNIEICPREIFYVDDGLEADENFWEIIPITKLDLSHNAIRVLPDDVERLAEALSVFKIRDNSLTELPEQLYSCVQLRHLDVGMNRLSRLSESIGDLPFLRELFLCSNELAHIPDALARCSALTVLELQDNKIQTLRDALYLPALIHLNVSSNQLNELSDCINVCANLQSLQCKKNNLVVLPDLSQLHKLVLLDASENRIEDFPVLPQGESNLDRVYLGNNRLSHINIRSLIPAQCATLSELCVNDNSLSEIPSELGLLSFLKVLDFANNSVSDIPASIGWMTTLTRVCAEGNPIRSIRRTVLTQSTVELKNYLRTRGPPASASASAPSAEPASRQSRPSNPRAAGRGGGSVIDFEYDPYDPDAQVNDDDIFSQRIRAMHAQMLDLSNTLSSQQPTKQAQSQAQAQEFPSNLLHKLQTSHAFDSETMTLSGILKLNLSNNNLMSVPVDILLQLPQLVELNMSSNCFGLVSPSQMCNKVSSISTMHPVLYPPSLRVLDISKCKLTSHHLLLFVMCGANLKELKANNNAIDMLPTEMNHEMKQLRVLQLSHNNIASVSNIDFANFRSLEIVDFSDNKLTDISPLLRSLLIAPAGSKITSVSVDNNNISQVPALFCRFPAMSHLGLYGNPQKTIRTNLLGNWEGIRKALENRVTPSDEEFLYTAMAPEPAPVPVPAPAPRPSASSNSSSFGGGSGGDRARNGTGHDRGASSFGYDMSDDISSLGSGRGVAMASSQHQSRSDNSLPQRLVEEDYRPRDDRRQYDRVQVEEYNPSGRRPQSLLDQQQQQQYARAMNDAAASRSVPSLPRYQQQQHMQQRYEDNDYIDNRQELQHRQQASFDREYAAPPRYSTQQQPPQPQQQQQPQAANISALRSEISALEREMDDLSISTNRRAQVKRTLALNRAQLLKLTR